MLSVNGSDDPKSPEILIKFYQSPFEEGIASFSLIKGMIIMNVIH
jgi:hypothetical protein